MTTGPMSQVGWARASSDGDVGELVAAAPAERAAAGRQHQPRDLAARRRRAGTGPAPSARSRPAPAAPASPRAVTRSPPAISDSLLASATVRPASSADSVGPQADRAGDPVEHDVGGAGGELLGGARSGEDLRQRVLALGPAALRCRRVEGQLEVLRGGGPGDGDGADAEGERLLGQQGDVASPGGQAGDPQPVGVLLRDRDRLPADGAGRAQDGDLAEGTHRAPVLPRDAPLLAVPRCDASRPVR